MEIQISDAKVERTGKSFKFSANYKVTAGKPDPLAKYRWEVELAGSKLPKGIKQTLSTLNGLGMLTEGPLSLATQDYGSDFGQGLNFTICMIEDKNSTLARCLGWTAPASWSRCQPTLPCPPRRQRS